MDNEAPCSRLSPQSSIQSVPFASADLSSPIPPLIFVQIILRFTVKKKAKQNNSKVTHSKAIHRANAITCLT